MDSGPQILGRYQQIEGGIGWSRELSRPDDPRRVLKPVQPEAFVHAPEGLEASLVQCIDLSIGVLLATGRDAGDRRRGRTSAARVADRASSLTLGTGLACAQPAQ